MPPDPPSGRMLMHVIYINNFIQASPPQCRSGTLKHVKNTSRMPQIQFRSIHSKKFSGGRTLPDPTSGGIFTHTHYIYINNFTQVSPKLKILYETLPGLCALCSLSNVGLLFITISLVPKLVLIFPPNF